MGETKGKEKERKGWDTTHTHTHLYLPRTPVEHLKKCDEP